MKEVYEDEAMSSFFSSPFYSHRDTEQWNQWVQDSELNQAGESGSDKN